MMKIKLVIVIILMLFLQSCSENASTKDNHQRHLRAAEAFYHQGQMRAAVVEANNAIDQNADDGKAHLLLAKIYNDIGSYQEASEFIEIHLKQFPDLIHELIRSYYYRNKLVSIASLAKSAKIDSLDNATQIKTQKYLALSFLQLGETDQYLKSLNKIRELNSAANEVEFIEAYALTLANDLENAEAKLKHLLVEDLDFDAVILLSLLYIDENRLQEAEALLTKLLLKLPATDVVTAERLRILTLMVDVLIGQGRTSEALVYQRLVASANPDAFFARQEIQQASELYAQNRYSDAKQLLEKLAIKFPANSKIQSMLAMVNFRLGDDRALLDLFGGGFDPESAVSSIIQAAAIAKFRAQESDEAIELLQQAVTAKPNNVYLLSSLGMALLSENPLNPKGADKLKQSLALEANQPRARLSLAHHYQAVGDSEAAQQQLASAYLQAPSDAYVAQQYFEYQFKNNKNDLFNSLTQRVNEQGHTSLEAFFLAWYQHRDGQLEQAEQNYRRGLEKSSGTLKTLFMAGAARLAIERNDEQAAMSLFEQLIKLDVTSVAPYVEWFKLIAKNEEWTRAKAFIAEIKLSGDVWVHHLIAAEIALADKDIQSALAAVENALALNPNAVMVQRKAFSIYTLLAEIAELNQDYSTARKRYLQAINIFPKNLDVLIRLVNLELKAGELGEAQTIVNQYIDDDERFAKHYLNARIYFNQGNTDEGLKELRLSWSERPTDLVGDAIYLYFDSRNQHQLANQFLVEWLDAIPTSVRAHLYKAALAERQKNPAYAVVIYEDVLKLDPLNIIAANNLATLYLSKNPEMALSYAKKAVELAPNSAAVVDTLGMAYLKLGQIDKAIEFFKQALAAEPNNTAFKAHLDSATKVLEQSKAP